VTVGVGDGLTVGDGEGVAVLDGVDSRRDDGVRLGLADWVGRGLALRGGDEDRPADAVVRDAVRRTVAVDDGFGATHTYSVSTARKKMLITAVEVRTRRYLCIRDRISSHRSSRRCRGWHAG
jgi:hypothetical protein